MANRGTGNLPRGGISPSLKKVIDILSSLGYLRQIFTDRLYRHYFAAFLPTWQLPAPFSGNSWFI